LPARVTNSGRSSRITRAAISAAWAVRSAQ
jgi:hypothetical protein